VFLKWKEACEYKSEVLTAASIQIVVFWVATTCSIETGYQRFEATCSTFTLTLEKGAGCSPETLMYAYNNTRCHNPQDCKLKAYEFYIHEVTSN
jgi:hypothetical protein